MATLGQYNAADMTGREVFEAGKKHLLEQGKKSVKKEISNSCLYDGPDGICCGAAPFVQNYAPEMEGDSWSELSVYGDQTERHKDLIQQLQIIHDQDSVDNWVVAFNDLEQEALDNGWIEPADKEN